MTLTTLLLGITIAALLFTALDKFVLHRVTSPVVSLLQNFCGALFVFSGWVKAIDPMGTAFKMEQYFAEFESTFAATSFDFLAPLFPWLAEYAIGFSVVMIVFEILLGVMLLVGMWPKFTAWAFFALVAFFTALTGFTYLTGYVQPGGTFFAFDTWGAYETTNMKVTDCGCFGDFLKLEPRTSFLKDVFLLLPALVFVFASERMHRLFSPTARLALAAAALVGSTFYCFSNYVWDIPGQDFRPFKVGVNIAERKQAEEEAAGAVQVLGYTMTEKATGKVTELTMAEYLKQYKDYPKEEFEIVQIKTEPTIAATKITDFELSDAEGNDVTYDLLSEPGFTFVVVAYKLKGTEAAGTYQWSEDYLDKWREDLLPVLAQAAEAGHQVRILTAYSDYERLNDFESALGVDYPVYTGDDIMLKTIIRSNPGLLLMSNGTILEKWHFRQLPDFRFIENNYRLAEGM